jgi:hypothetical protein
LDVSRYPSEQLWDRIKVIAAERRLQDSQMVEELLWLALSLVDETSAMEGAQKS